MSQAFHPDRGFTLIEILVTTAALAILAAILSSATTHALVSAKKTKCASNMRQIGLAILTYAGEHAGSLPPTRHAASQGHAWIDLLAPYLQNLDEVRICPADTKRTERLRRKGTSYIVNDSIFDIRTDAFGNPLPDSIANLMRIKNPGKTILAFTISDNRGTGPSNDHTHSAQWNSFQRFLADVEADRHRPGPRSPNRDQGSANYLYADGSVRNIPSKTMRDWFATGKNPALVNHAP